MASAFPGNSDNNNPSQNMSDDSGSRKRRNAESDLDPSNILTSNRVSKKPYKPGAFLFGPKYGPADPHFGGSEMTAVLTTGAIDAANNKGSQKTKGPSIMKVLHTDPNETYVSGHLLNAQLGGVGSTRNETPLTSSANSQHETIENRLNNYLTTLRQKLDYIGRPNYADYIGFLYKVKVDKANPLLNPSDVMKEIESNKFLIGNQVEGIHISIDPFVKNDNNNTLSDDDKTKMKKIILSFDPISEFIPNA